LWADAVTAYATGLSGKDVLDDPLPAIARSLAGADDAPTLTGVPIDAALAATLERAAPVYRRAWWPAHRASNRAWQSSIEMLIDRHGRTILGFITRAYGMEWPTAGYPVHLSGYANWAGAYSSLRANVLVVSSLDAGNGGLRGLETIFHESMHQWDGRVFAALNAQAKVLKTTVPGDLPHAMIFFTAGEAVRRVEPDHVPYADAFGIWQLRLSGAPVPALRLKAPLEEIWKPYLDGRGARDDVFAALLAKVAAESGR
jgi:hypothetical protein